jgi:hypothetical protein
MVYGCNMGSKPDVQVVNKCTNCNKDFKKPVKNKSVKCKACRTKEEEEDEEEEEKKEEEEDEFEEEGEEAKEGTPIVCVCVSVHVCVCMFVCVCTRAHVYMCILCLFHVCALSKIGDHPRTNTKSNLELTRKSQV